MYVHIHVHIGKVWGMLEGTWQDIYMGCSWMKRLWSFIYFLYLLNFMLLEDVAFISTEIGSKNRINKGNLGGSQSKNILKIHPLRFLQWVLFSIFFWVTRTESVLFSLWIVTFITSPPSCYDNLPSVFLTCWGLSKAWVLSKARRLGTALGERWNFCRFSSVFFSPGPPPLRLCIRGPCSHAPSAPGATLAVWQWQPPSLVGFIFTSCQITLGGVSGLGEWWERPTIHPSVKHCEQLHWNLAISPAPQLISYVLIEKDPFKGLCGKYPNNRVTKTGHHF